MQIQGIQITVTAIISKKSRLSVESKNVFLSFCLNVIISAGRGPQVSGQSGCRMWGVRKIKSIFNLCSKTSRTISFWAVIDRVTLPLFFLITLHFLLQCLWFLQTNTFLPARASRVAFHTHSTPFLTSQLENWAVTMYLKDDYYHQ